MSAKFSSRKAKVTKEWAALSPNLAVWKPKHLVRMHGPLVLGVCLDAVRSPDAYLPCFHIHNLTTPFDVITLGLKGPLLSKRGANEQIKLARHDSELPLIVGMLTDQYPLIAKPTLTYNDYVMTVANVLSGKHGAGRGGSLPLILRDVVLLACACGAVDHARAELKTFSGYLAGRTDCDVPFIGGFDKWRTGVEAMLDPVKLGQVVAAEKAKHGLDGFDDHGLELGTPVPLFDTYSP